MKNLISIIVLFFLLCGFTQAQEKKEIKGDVKKFSSTESMPTMISKENTNPNEIKPMRSDAGAPLSPTNGCSVEVSNYTYWDLSCYVIDERDIEKITKKGKLSYSAYEGINSRTKGTVTLKSGACCLIVYAQFTDGTYAMWGPMCVECYGESYTLDITEDNYSYVGE
jgi:hypothetical protein